MDWGGCDAEVYMLMVERKMSELPEALNLPEDRKMNVVFEGRAPAYFACGRREHMRSAGWVFLERGESSCEASEE